MMSRLPPRQQLNTFGLRNVATAEPNGEVKPANETQTKVLLEKIAMLSSQNTFKSQPS
jgi:hypothetical protein